MIPYIGRFGLGATASVHRCKSGMVDILSLTSFCIGGKGIKEGMAEYTFLSSDSNGIVERHSRRTPLKSHIASLRYLSREGVSRLANALGFTPWNANPAAEETRNKSFKSVFSRGYQRIDVLQIPTPASHSSEELHFARLLHLAIDCPLERQRHPSSPESPPARSPRAASPSPRTSKIRACETARPETIR